MRSVDKETISTQHVPQSGITENECTTKLRSYLDFPGVVRGGIK